MGCLSRFTSQIGQFPGGNRVLILADKNVSLQQCSSLAVLRAKTLLLMVRNSKSIPGDGSKEPRQGLGKPVGSPSALLPAPVAASRPRCPSASAGDQSEFCRLQTSGTPTRNAQPQPSSAREQAAPCRWGTGTIRRLRSPATRCSCPAGTPGPALIPGRARYVTRWPLDVPGTPRRPRCRSGCRTALRPPSAGAPQPLRSLPAAPGRHPPAPRHGGDAGHGYATEALRLWRWPLPL